MNPYYSDDLVTLYHGDAFDVLPDLERESFAHCVTDPPYILQAGSSSTKGSKTGGLGPNDGESVESWQARRERVKATANNGNGMGTPLSIAVRMAPDRWGEYAAAIARWEAIHGPAPAPTKVGKKGNRKLNPAFSAWMMGAPAGWITDVPGITDNQASHAIGNGVVPHQGAAALRVLLDRISRWTEPA